MQYKTVQQLHSRQVMCNGIQSTRHELHKRKCYGPSIRTDNEREYNFPATGPFTSCCPYSIFLSHSWLRSLFFLFHFYYLIFIFTCCFSLFFIFCVICRLQFAVNIFNMEYALLCMSLAMRCSYGRFS